MIRPVDALAPKAYFKGQSNGYENPVNQKMEKRLALANAAGISTVIGAVTTAAARGAVSSWKSASGIGAVAAGLSLMFLAPMFMYRAGVNSFAKEKEMDVFVHETEMHKKLIADVNSAIDNKSNSLPGKIENYSKTLVKRAL